MKILLDANTPVPLGRCLRGHDVTASKTVGWDKFTNGVLLDRAEAAGYDVLVTCDKNLPYQQNFTQRRIAVVVLPTTRWPVLERLSARILTTVDFIGPGQVVRVEM
jgi:hypothetical protein